MSNHSTSQTPVRSVERALDIVLCIARATQPMSLSEIARSVVLHKSTVYRLMLSLQNKGFVRRDPESDKYVLGWSVLELLGNPHWSDALTSVSLSEMRRLRDITGETVSLYVRSGIERIRVQALQSEHPIRNVVSVGASYPLYVGASGKVLLAFSNNSLLEEVFSRSDVPAHFDKEELREQLDTIRMDGFAISIQERDAEAAAMAAPVLGRNGECLAALAVSGPVSRLTTPRMKQFVEALCDSAHRLSNSVPT